MGWRKIELPRITDARGDLTFVESGAHIPFDIARVYYLYNVPTNAERGGHAHRRLQQVIFAMSGSFRLRLFDGKMREDVWLNNPWTGVFVDTFVWREIDSFSQGGVLMCLASEPYDASEYIRDQDEFLRLARPA